MDPLTIIAAIGTAIKIAEVAIAAGRSAAPIFAALRDRIFNKPVGNVTSDDLDALAAVSDAMTAALMKPLDSD